MKSHKWEVEEVDGGPVGTGHFWVCHICTASGGPVGGWSGRDQAEGPSWKPFLAGPAVTLSTDCDEAAKQIAEHWVKKAADESARAKAKLERKAQNKLLRIQSGKDGLDSRTRNIVAFLRENWRNNDGAEGDSVHALCDAVERLGLEVASLKAKDKS